MPRKFIPPLLVFAVFALRLAAIRTTDPHSATGLFPDDAFYYLSLARNTLDGRGVSFASTGIATTGFQPLWLLIEAGTFAVPGPLPPERAVFVAQLLSASFGVLAACALYRIARRLASPGVGVIALALFALSPAAILATVNGMETALATLAALLVFGLAVGPRRPPAFVLGLLAGLAVLARADLIILVAIAGVAAIRSVRPRAIGLTTAGFAVALAPWLAFSFATTGGAIPESGAAVRQISLAMAGLPLLSPADSLIRGPDTFLPYYARNAIDFSRLWAEQTPALAPVGMLARAFRLSGEWAILAALGAALIGVGLAIRSDSSPLRKAAAIWAVWGVALTLAYAAGALAPWFFARYGFPLATVGGAILLAVLGELVARYRPPVRVALAGVLILTLSASRPYSPPPDDGFYRTARWLDSELPPDSRVGVFQAGLIGVYSGQRIVAVDGKLNGPARTAIGRGDFAGYLCGDGIEYLADWPASADALAPDAGPRLSLVATIPVPEVRDFAVYRVDRNRLCQTPEGGAAAGEEVPAGRE